MPQTTNQYVSHRATLRFSRNQSNETERREIGELEYIPCAAAFAYWPETKAQWDARALWAVHLCEHCAVKYGFIWLRD